MLRDAIEIRREVHGRSTIDRMGSVPSAPWLGGKRPVSSRFRSGETMVAFSVKHHYVMSCHDQNRKSEEESRHQAIRS